MFATSERKLAKRAARRKGPWKWLRFRLEYFVVRCVTTVLLAVGSRFALRLARGLGRIAFLIDIRHRRIGMENLDRVYGDRMSRREKGRLLLRVYESLALILVELLWAQRLIHSENLDRFLDTEAVGAHPEVFDHPRGVLLLTAHLGNWEVGPFYFSRRGFEFHSVARPLDNPLLDRYLSRLRGGTGESLISKIGALQGMLGALGRRGVIVALPLDQNAGSGGTFVDFLGSPASTNSAALLVAKKKKVPVAVGAVVRVSPMRFRLLLVDHIRPEEVRAMDVVALTARVTEAIARLVREYPDQWMWTHRRWKSRPPVELEKAIR